MKKKSPHYYVKTILIFLFIGFSIFLGLKGLQNSKEQQAIDKLVAQGGYPEIKGKLPTFNTDIVTSYSTTHVISYLPKSLLGKNNFDEKAAKNTIGFVEKIATKEYSFTLSPSATTSAEIRVVLERRTIKGYNNFVFLVSDIDPLPKLLSDIQNQFPALHTAMAGHKTFFWTTSLKGVNVFITFLHFSEDQTWQYGLPTERNEKFTALQQLNEGFNLELWRRATVAAPYARNEKNVDVPKLFAARESLWNTFGQLTTAKQEGTPLSLMKERFKRRTINGGVNNIYYPLDDKALQIYLLAPTNPILR